MAGIRRFSGPARWWVAGLFVALALVALAWGVGRHVTSAGHIEKRLSSAISSANGVNRVSIGASRFSPWRGAFSASDLEFVPDTLLLAPRTLAGSAPPTRYSVTVSSLRVHGIRFWPLLRGGVVADSITVDGARVDVMVDRTAGPARPAGVHTLPHALLRSLGRSVRIDVIRVTNADIGYSERAIDGGRPGTIRFTDLWATVHNVTNDSTLLVSTPCTIDIRTRVAGAGRLNATFRYDLLSPRLSMTCRGTVARIGAEPLNELLVNLEGIRITSGVVDSTWFDFNVSDDVARGAVQVLYRDLGIEMLDKVTLDRGLGNRIQTLIADRGTLNRSNPVDDQTPAKIAMIGRERTPETPLFKFLWETVREGILWTLGF